jgi:thiopeptide-type bacteriocin biosynthesis protein
VRDQVDRRFFLRYHDDRAHLRIRLHGAPDALNGVVLPALNRWASELHDSRLRSELILGSYEAEIVRYGGEQAIEAAERLFAAYSESVLTQLRLRRAGRIDDVTDELLVAANYVDLLRGTGNRDWPEWLVSTYVKDEEHHHAFTAVRERAIRLLDLTGEWPG